MINNVTRRMEFSTADIKQAIIEWLRERDQPAPNGNEVTFSFRLTEDGAEMSWMESADLRGKV